MLFENVLGQEPIKNHLINSANKGRIPHAQLFVGPEGCGHLAMAIAYAGHLLAQGQTPEKQKTTLEKVAQFLHPDLHFAFPVASTDEIKSENVFSDNFLEQWRSFLKESPYAGLLDWFKKLEIPKKQGIINVKDAEQINKKLALKAYEGGFKIMIVWMAEKMNTQAANKLLKLLEEPPEKTVFILITENPSDLLQTIISRCQVVDFLALPEEVIKNALQRNLGIDEQRATQIAHQCEGNYNKAMQLLDLNDELALFEEWFVSWTRTAYSAKKNPSAVNNLMAWSSAISKEGREKQKNFLKYCVQMFRQAFLLNYQINELVFITPSYDNFKLENLAPFVHSANIQGIYNELEKAIYHIERNGNGNIVFTDLSIKLTRLFHLKETTL